MKTLDLFILSEQSINVFVTDYINEVLHEQDDTDVKSIKEEWDSPITFTAKSSRKCFYVQLR